MKKFLLLCILASAVAFAGEGSVYSRFGVGEINVFTNARGVGMGGAGLALLSESNLSFANPASLGNITRTLFTAGYQYRSYNSEDATGTSVIGTGALNEFGLAFPIHSQNKIVLSFGIVPFSSVGYEQRQTRLFDDNTITYIYEGRGGISSAQIGMSYAPLTDLYLGVTGHYMFGSIYNDQSINYSGSGFYSGSYNRTLSMSGVAVSVGALYSGIDKALGFSDTKNMNAALTIFSGSAMSLDDELLRNFSSNQDTISDNGRTLDLPFGISAGIAYTKNRIIYAADVQFQNWDNFTIKGSHPSELQNSYRLGAGVEYLQSNTFTDDFWEKISLRIGGYYRATNLNVNGESINELFGTAGIGLPFSFESRINLGLEAGIRGTVSGALVKDTIVRFTVSLTASELMFIPPVID